jgi:tetratricopeptide (TPR) repeat protein
MLDVELFALRPAGHHGTSVALHALNGALLFWWLSGCTRRFWPSLAAAAFFAIHPLRVESVAWIAERKDVLAGSFWLATLLAYSAHARRPSVARFALVFLCMALGLLAKAMLVTLPLVLLLLDVWPYRRWSGTNARRLVLEKLPLLALSVGFSVVAVLSQKATASLKSFEVLPVSARLGQAFLAYAGYLGKLLWPSHLAVFYPHPATQLSPGEFTLRAVLAAILLIALSAALFRWRRRSPWMIGWLWFLGSLVPVIGIVQVGSQGIADRYTYLPSIGLSIALAFGAAEFAARSRRWRALLPPLAILLFSASIVLTARQVGTWSNSRSLFQHAIEVTKRNHVAHASLGLALLADGDAASARGEFQRALEIEPRDANAQHNLGLLCLGVGDLEGARRHLAAAVELQPDAPEPHAGMGDLFRQTGNLEWAVASYRRAIELDPSYVAAHLNLGVALFRLDRLDEAIEANRSALAVDPRSVDAYNNLGAIAARQGDTAEALSNYRSALGLDPQRTRIRFHVGGLLMELGRLEEAKGELLRVAREAPTVADVHERLAKLSLALHDDATARQALERTLALDPQRRSAALDLAWLLATSPHPEIRDCEMAQRLVHQAALEESTAAKELELLAAVSAECGDFEAALRWQEAALAASADASEEMSRRRDAYAARQPFRQH